DGNQERLRCAGVARRQVGRLRCHFRGHERKRERCGCLACLDRGWRTHQAHYEQKERYSASLVFRWKKHCLHLGSRRETSDLSDLTLRRRSRKTHRLEIGSAVI